MATTVTRRARPPARSDKETIKRRNEILDDIGELDSMRKDLLTPVATEVAWLEFKLVATRLLISNQSVVSQYDNGGGQVGTRKNPAYDGYHALLKSYTSALRMLYELAGRADMNAKDGQDDLADMRRSSPLFKAV